MKHLLHFIRRYENIAIKKKIRNFCPVKNRGKIPHSALGGNWCNAPTSAGGDPRGLFSTTAAPSGGGCRKQTAVSLFWEDSAA